MNKSKGIWINFRSAFSAAMCLILISFFLIGGCSSNSNSNKSSDALTIGELNGEIVPAVKAEYALMNWQEGDADSNFFLNGTTVSTLTQAQIDALNSAYQAGFFIGLIDPILQEVDELHDILGLKRLIVETGPLDIFAVSRELDVSGVRYYRMHAIPPDGTPTEKSFQRQRVQLLVAWENIASSATLSARDTGMMSNNLMVLADSISYSEAFSIKSGGSTSLGRNQDFKGHFRATARGWSLHSVENNSDFYFIQTLYEFAPDTSLRTSPTEAEWPCVSNLNILDRDTQLRGVNNYTSNNVVFDGLTSTEIALIDSSPLTTEGEVTTSSSISTTVSGGVSFNENDGVGINFSESATYTNSRSYTSPSITTSNLSLNGPGANNAAWNFDVFNANAATATFQPVGQWYWEANSDLRKRLKCSVGRSDYCTQFTLNLGVTYYPVSCLFIPTESTTFTQSEAWPLNFPVPPTPPPPTMAP